MQKQTSATKVKLFQNKDAAFKDKIQERKDQLVFFTGKFQKQFDDVSVLGKGGFGVVMKAKDRLEDKYYAIKKVRLHLSLENDIIEELKNHRTFREVKALTTYESAELPHTVRYYSYWLEDLSRDEFNLEKERLERYRCKRLSSINEEENSEELRSSYE